MYVEKSIRSEFSTDRNVRPFLIKKNGRHSPKKSRGSIGSSILAMFAGITTNNALPPHYHCPNCHKHEWVPEQKRDYEIGDEIITKILKNGLDYETRTCPECGHEMWSDGFSGDFRSFMGAD